MKKTLAILGDSYSTYVGWIPEDYLTWYNDTGNALENDMTSVEQTWWKKLCEAGKFELISNCSYSGSTVCNTWYDQKDASDLSFIKRMQREFGESTETPDIMLIFGGTNDFWAEVPVGSEQYADWTGEDLKKFTPAFCYMISYLRNTHPGIELYNIINDDITGAVREAMCKVCRHFNIPCILLENIEKENGHPNQKGMTQIFEQVWSVLKKANKK